MPFEKGDFVFIDYVAKVKETGEVFDATTEEIARKEKLYREGEIYEPNLIVIGEGWVLKTLDESFSLWNWAKQHPLRSRLKRPSETAIPKK